MKAITLTQPWATLMAAGEKCIETRSWPPYGLRKGEPVAIHAGKGFADMNAREFCEMCIREPFRSALVGAWKRGLIVSHQLEGVYPGDLPRGGIVAVATFYAVYRTDQPDTVERLIQQFGATHERAFGNYGPGRWAWVFTDARMVMPPIPARGKQGLWTWDVPVARFTTLAPSRTEA